MSNTKPSSIIARLEKEFIALKNKLNFLAKDLQEAKKAASNKPIKKVVTKIAIKPTVAKTTIKKVIKPVAKKTIQKMATKVSSKSKPAKKK